VFSELTPGRWPQRALRTDLLLALASFTLLGYVGIVVGQQPGTIAVIWVANGAATALIVSAPASRLLPMLAASVAGNLVANLVWGRPPAMAVAFLLPNALEIALGVWLLRSAGDTHRWAETLPRFAKTLLLGAMLPPLLGATTGAATLDLLGFVPFGRAWLDWYVGAATGSVAMLPLLLELRAGNLRRRLRLALTPTAVLALLLLPLVLAAVLEWFPYPFVALLLATLLVATLFQRLVGFAAAATTLATVAVTLATHHFVITVPDTPQGHALVFAAVLMALVPAQVTAVLVARQKAVDGLLGAVASRSDEIVLVSDLDGVLRWASRARETYRGEANAQVLGRPLTELAARGLVSPEAVHDHAQAVAGGTLERMQKVEYPLRGPRTMRVHVQPARDDTGAQVGVLATATDVTELEATAEQLRRSNANLEQFVRVASHDLREPMNTIQQFVSLIEESMGERLPAQERAWFTHVRSGARRMKQLLDDVLQYVQLDDEPDEPRAQVSLDELATDTRAALGAQLGASGALLEVGPLGTVRGHRSLLALLLQNLVSNALKFSRPGIRPQVRLHSETAPGELRLVIADNGIGIPADKLAQIGQPFRRLHNRRKYEGTGLGLAICRGILERHGGRLEIASVLGEGSTFTAVLPLHAPGAAGAAAATSPPAPARSLP
jgi:PAS domain S-box-containing protein